MRNCIDCSRVMPRAKTALRCKTCWARHRYNTNPQFRRRVKAAAMRWVNANREIMNERRRDRYHDPTSGVKASKVKWHSENREKVNASYRRAKIRRYKAIAGAFGITIFGAEHRMKKFCIRVARRAGGACEECGVRNVPLQVHHIRPVLKYPEKAFRMDNVLLLCKNPCHMNAERKIRGQKLHKGRRG